MFYFVIIVKKSSAGNLFQFWLSSSTLALTTEHDDGWILSPTRFVFHFTLIFFCDKMTRNFICQTYEAVPHFIMPTFHITISNFVSSSGQRVVRYVLHRIHSTSYM